MPRTVWFSLICLIGVATLIVVRSLPSVMKQKPPMMVEPSDSGSPAAKSDSLLQAEQAAPERVVVKTVKIVATSSAAKQNPKAEKQNPRVESRRHARHAYARMRGRRHFARHRRRHTRG